jgi:hypothetical protein
VDYNGIAEDRLFFEYMESLNRADPGRLSRDGRLAFWINAYNAVIIDKVIRMRPKKSVRETLIPGHTDRPSGKYALTLKNIRLVESDFVEKSGFNSSPKTEGVLIRAKKPSSLNIQK